MLTRWKLTRWGYLVVAVFVIAVLFVASCGGAEPTATPVPTKAPAPTATAVPPTTTPVTPVQSTPTLAPSPILAAPTATLTRVPPTPTATPSIKRGGILRAWSTSDPSNLDPIQIATVFTQQLTSLVYNNPFFFDPHAPGEQKPVPDLATSAVLSADGLTWTLKVRPGVTWSDSQAVTSADFKISLERIVNPPKGVTSVNSSLYQVIDTVEAPDPNTVVIRLKQPSAPFLSLVSWAWAAVMPKHILDQNPKALEQTMLGSGPYILKEWAKGVSLTFARNPNYFKPGLPYLEGVQYAIIADAAAQTAALMTRQLDVTGWGSRGITRDEANQLKSRYPNGKVYETVCGCPIPMRFNMTKPPFNDLRVRQAFFLASDQNLIRQLYLNGLGQTGGYMPRGEWSLPNVDELPMVVGPKPADIERAKKLLADAGYSNGFETTYTGPALPFYDGVGIAYQTALKKIGVTVKMVQLAYPATFFDQLAKGNFDFGIELAAFPLNDPNSWLSIWTTGDSRNYGGFSDATVDALYQQQAVTVDPTKRKELVIKLQQRLLELMPGFPSLHLVFQNFFQDYVRNYDGPGFLYDNLRLEDIWLDK